MLRADLAVLPTVRWLSDRPAIEGALLFLCAALAKPAGTPLVVLLLAAGGAFCVRAALDTTNTDSRVIRQAAYGAFGLRWALAVGLYCASLYRWPIGRSLQAGNGFWLFCMDALNYHTWAPVILNAVSRGLPLPSPGATVDYYLVIAFIYGVFGTSPLTAIAFNILAWTLATILILRLFGEMRGAPMQTPLALVILLWPSGFIWPTQLMKDSLVFFFLVVAAAAGAAFITSGRRTTNRLAAAALLAIALVPLLRLRVYVGRMLLGSAAIAACAALISLPWHRRAWRNALAAVVVGAFAYWGLIFILAPDPFVLLAPVPSAAASIDADAPGPSARLAEPSTARQAPSRREQMLAMFSRLRESLVAAAANSDSDISSNLEAMSPSDLGIMRDKFSATGGASANDEGRRITGWRDALRVGPSALADGLFAPYPWDVFRPRGITGIFRTFDVSESVLMLLLTPALIVGVTRIRRAEEWFILALAGGGLLASSLVITNVGTLVRLRVAFTLLLAAFACYGFDVYAAISATPRRNKTEAPTSHHFKIAG